MIESAAHDPAFGGICAADFLCDGDSGEKLDKNIPT